MTGFLVQQNPLCLLEGDGVTDLTANASFINLARSFHRVSGYLQRWHSTEVRLIDVVSDPALILLIEAAIISSLLIVCGFSSQMWRNLVVKSDGVAPSSFGRGIVMRASTCFWMKSKTNPIAFMLGKSKAFA